MLLAIDVGNTQTVIGMYEPPADGAAVPSGRGAETDLLHHWRVATVAERTPDEHALLIAELLDLDGHRAEEVVTGIAVSSVVPRVTAALREMIARRYQVFSVVVEPGVRTGMPILYDNPKEVGADRIANAVAAIDLYGGPCIVVDFGTATTLDAISPKGEYLGGAIIPGIEISLDALFERAAALRRVELVEPRHVIGRSTVESIQSGAIYGYAAQVDGLCRRMAAEIDPAATVMCTGGLGGFISRLCQTIEHVEPWLTLHGLRVIYERNLS